MTTVAHQAKKGYRTLRVPVAEHEYDLFVSDKTFARERLEYLYSVSVVTRLRKGEIQKPESKIGGQTWFSDDAQLKT